MRDQASEISRRAVSLDVTPVNEDLWFDTSVDEEAEAKAANSMAALVGRILGAKPLPIAARRLAELTRSPNARIEQTVRVLESDPALSARLLRLVNSAGYALRARCGSVHHAAALVGTRRIHQVATTAAVLDLFDASSETAVRLLEHAAVVGALCRYLAVHLGLPRDEMFTSGFLHDIGKLMLLDTEGEAYGALIDAEGEAVDAHHLAERAQYGYDHAVLAGHVLAAWNIPDPIPRVVAWHHSPARAYEAGGMVGAMVAAVRLADSLSGALGEEDTTAAITRIARGDSAAYLDVSEAQLAAMWDELQTLREQSTARSRGVDVPEKELLPRHQIRKSAPRGLASHAVQAPMHFPCVVCQKPSYGNVCPCCQGYVCPTHQTGSHEWCSACTRTFTNSLSRSRLGLRSKAGVAAAATALASTAAAGAAATAEPAAWANIVVAPLLSLLFGATLFVVGRKWYVRAEFVKTRRRQRAEGAPDSSRSLEETAEMPAVSARPEELLVMPSLNAPGPAISFRVEDEALSARYAAGAPSLRVEKQATPPSFVPERLAVDPPSIIVTLRPDSSASPGSLRESLVVSEPPLAHSAIQTLLGLPSLPLVEATPTSAAEMPVAVSVAPSPTFAAEPEPSFTPAPTLAPEASVSVAPAPVLALEAGPSIAPAPTLADAPLSVAPAPILAPEVVSNERLEAPAVGDSFAASNSVAETSTSEPEPEPEVRPPFVAPPRNVAGAAYRERCQSVAPWRPCVTATASVDGSHTPGDVFVNPAAPEAPSTEVLSAVLDSDSSPAVAVANDLSDAVVAPSATPSAELARDDRSSSEPSPRSAVRASRPPADRVSGAVFSLPPGYLDEDGLYSLRGSSLRHGPRSLRRASRLRWG